MGKKTNDKAKRLVFNTRVMTFAVFDKEIPWSTPVYFVFHDNNFYFFSNEKSKHIQCAKEQKIISVSIFHDSNQMDQIFGFQMSGKIAKISNTILYLKIVKEYVSKFDFLNQIFGSEIIKNQTFFLEKFKSHLYCFSPDNIFISENSKITEKRIKIDLNQIL